MTGTPQERLATAVRDLMVLGEVIAAMAAANSGDGHDLIPATWVTKTTTRLATIPDHFCSAATPDHYRRLQIWPCIWAAVNNAF